MIRRRADDDDRIHRHSERRFRWHRFPRCHCRYRSRCPRLPRLRTEFLLSVPPKDILVSEQEETWSRRSRRSKQMPRSTMTTTVERRRRRRRRRVVERERENWRRRCRCCCCSRRRRRLVAAWKRTRILRLRRRKSASVPWAGRKKEIGTRRRKDPRRKARPTTTLRNTERNTDR